MPDAFLTKLPTSSSVTSATIGATAGAVGATGISGATGATSGIAAATGAAGGASGAIAVPIGAPGAPAAGAGAGAFPVTRCTPFLTAWTTGGATRCKICPAGPVAAAVTTSPVSNLPPVPAWVASMAAWVAPPATIAPGMVAARPAGVKAATAPAARGMSPIVKPGGIAYSF